MFWLLLYMLLSTVESQYWENICNNNYWGTEYTMYSEELDCIISLENAKCTIECCYQEVRRKQLTTTLCQNLLSEFCMENAKCFTAALKTYYRDFDTIYSIKNVKNSRKSSGNQTSYKPSVSTPTVRASTSGSSTTQSPTLSPSVSTQPERRKFQKLLKTDSSIRSSSEQRREDMPLTETETPPHLQVAESPLSTCRRFLDSCFNYGIISIVVIVLLFVALCIVAFSRQRDNTNPVSFIIKRAKFMINSEDQDVESNNGENNGSEENHSRPTIPPIPPFFDEVPEGSGEQ